MKTFKLGITGISMLSVLLIFVGQALAATVSVEVQGDGYVDSYPSGILCGAACVETYSDSTRMVLTAHPKEGASFLLIEL